MSRLLIIVTLLTCSARAAAPDANKSSDRTIQIPVPPGPKSLPPSLPALSFVPPSGLTPSWMEASEPEWDDMKKAWLSGDIDQARKSARQLADKTTAPKGARGMGQGMLKDLERIGARTRPLRVSWISGDIKALLNKKLLLIAVGMAGERYSEAMWGRLADIHQKLAPSGLGIIGIGVGIDPRRTQLQEFSKKLNIPYPLAVEKARSVMTDFDNNSVPRLFLVKNGFVVWRGDPMFFAPELAESWLKL